MIHEGLTESLKRLKLDISRRFVGDNKVELKIKELSKYYNIPTWEIQAHLETIRI